ncbi:ribonuclease HIII [Mycoplasmopsis bovis]|uniref:Ribonuclease n=2 Tax=Mycoplasmopsis bovis TaxID=28903 RepID=A0A2N8U1T8_MYCBV|nr:ribonuclease HIII [Mycoplasmopsis bovis]AXJ68669.1 ribonuclease HIII [Mycoplasmopsis bovis]AXJ69055.1 ribonuclease HIII [Mycoplasmopsis bovis]AXJ69836.1 ribonuclease HIII [Mycoplasmopsis bovis]AXJ70618.1 ribonuclease HIII [Mycoplasmopsis bovis]AXJ71454.1 ribonuclease HIII [Mycoplasmopsis bovis]
MQFLDLDVESSLLENKSIIGVDEVGVGDYFGPLCACAVFIDAQNVNKVAELGIKDSKKLSDKRIKELALKLKNSGLIHYSLAHLNPSGYNKLNKSYNANILKMFVHLKAINSVVFKLKNIKYDYIFIDKYASVDNMLKYYNELVINNNWANFQEINEDILIANKAESYSISVAAASILARDQFLTLVSKMNDEYNTVFPLGAGPKVNAFAKDFFAKHSYDEEVIKKTCKKSFKMNILN